MSFADANRTSIRVIEETTWGVTPANGKSREIRLTSSSLSASKETVVSDEIRADRMTSDMTEVSAASGGDINFEFSAGAYDEFLAAFLMGAWTRPMTRDFWKGDSIAVTANDTIVVYGADLTQYLTAGRWIRTKGFANGANNGFFTISAISYGSGNTTITTTQTTLVVAAGIAAHRLYDANDVIVRSSVVASTSTGFSGTGNPFASAIAAGQLVAGQNIHVSGLAGQDGYYKILAVTATDITTSPAPAAVVASGSAVTIRGSLLRNPSVVSQIVQRKFTVETGYNDIGQFQIQNGMVPGSFSLDISSGSIITGAITFQGKQTVMQTSTLLNTAPYTPLGTTNGEVINATVNVGAIQKDGTTLSTAIQSLSLSGEGGLRQQLAIGSKFARGIGAGRLTISGSISAYFEDASMYNHFLNHDTVSLSWRLTDADGQVYIFTIPAVKFSQDDIAPGGIDQDVMESLEWTAIREATTGCMLQIDRFSPA